jgi:hypothetical protein
MRGRVAAEPQAVQSDRTGDHGGDRDDQPARIVTGNVVVARVRDKIVGNDVYRTVRHDGRGGSSSDHQCDKRARNDGHWCAHSSPLPLPPREGDPGTVTKQHAARPSGAMRRTNMLMNKRARVLRAILRGIARVQRTFTIEVGPVRASGLPAVLLGVTGIILASGVTAALSKGASRLPETLGEARNLADALNAGSPRLKS